MNGLVTKIAVNTALLMTLVAAGSAYGQTSEGDQHSKPARR